MNYFFGLRLIGLNLFFAYNMTIKHSLIEHILYISLCIYITLIVFGSPRSKGNNSGKIVVANSNSFIFQFVRFIQFSLFVKFVLSVSRRNLFSTVSHLTLCEEDYGIIWLTGMLVWLSLLFSKAKCMAKIFSLQEIIELVLDNRQVSTEEASTLKDEEYSKDEDHLHSVGGGIGNGTD